MDSQKMSNSVSVRIDIEDAERVMKRARLMGATTLAAGVRMHLADVESGTTPAEDAARMARIEQMLKHLDQSGSASLATVTANLANEIEKLVNEVHALRIAIAQETNAGNVHARLSELEEVVRYLGEVTDYLLAVVKSSGRTP